MNTNNQKRICYCNITYKCNNRCKNCISHNVKKHTDREVCLSDYEYLQDLFHFNKNDIWTISGGEPTLSDNLIEIIDFCHNISKHVIMYSNGRNLKTIPYSTLKKIERIIVPIYGSKSEHNNYVGSANAYEETIDSLDSIIANDPQKVDIKFLLHENFKTEDVFDVDKWNLFKKNTHFSISRIIKSEQTRECSKDLVMKADCIMQELIKQEKKIRFYDLPICKLSDTMQQYLRTMPIEESEYSPLVICGSSQKRYKIFPFNKPTRIMEKCTNCDLSNLCSMIMQNYFCPMITPSTIKITTE